MVKNEDDAEFVVPKCQAPEDSIPKSRYHELQESIKKSEGRIAELEAEIATLKSEYDELKVKYKALELEKVREAGKEVQGTVVDLTEMELEIHDSDHELFQLKAENITLEHEKKKAENDAQIWKQMYHELKSSLGRSFEERMTAEVGATHDISVAGTPGSNLGRSGGLDNKKAIRSLFIEEERTPTGKMAPSTPMDHKPSCPAIINLDDSDDDEPDAIKADQEKAKIGTLGRIIDTENEKSSDCCLEDDMEVGLGTTQRSCTSKRKRAANMVTSDSENESDDDEDNIPLCQLKAKRFSKVSSDANGSSNLESGDDDTKELVTPRRRRLKRMSEVPTTKDDVEEIKSEEEDGSESSGDDSMKEFIVESSSDVSDDGSVGFHGDDSIDSSEEEGDCNSEMHGILSRLRRTKDQKFKWKFEGDMLADFGKDSELCMRAACVLYRQQTSDEQVSKEALHLNGRGFNKFDAHRGTEIGRFLTGGSGDMIKSVQELEAYDPNGVDKCREFAFKYAKQLFQIYQNGEDRFFSPSIDKK